MAGEGGREGGGVHQLLVQLWVRKNYLSLSFLMCDARTNILFTFFMCFFQPPHGLPARHCVLNTFLQKCKICNMDLKQENPSDGCYISCAVGLMSCSSFLPPVLPLKIPQINSLGALLIPSSATCQAPKINSFHPPSSLFRHPSCTTNQ